MDWTCNRPPPPRDWTPPTVVSSAQGVKAPTWRSLELLAFLEAVSPRCLDQQLRRRKRRRNWN